MNDPIITRADYMSGKATHSEYYGQLCENLAIAVVFPPEFLKRVRAAFNAGDEYFNTIPLKSWDTIAERVRRIMYEPLKERGDAWSMAGGVCIVKELARRAVTLPTTP